MTTRRLALVRGLRIDGHRLELENYCTLESDAHPSPGWRALWEIAGALRNPFTEWEVVLFEEVDGVARRLSDDRVCLDRLEGWLLGGSASQGREVAS